MANVVATAATQPFFATLGAASAARIMAMCEASVCPRNTVIFEAGDSADNLYLVVEGKVKGTDRTGAPLLLGRQSLEKQRHDGDGPTPDVTLDTPSPLEVFVGHLEDSNVGAVWQETGEVDVVVEDTSRDVLIVDVAHSLQQDFWCHKVGRASQGSETICVDHGWRLRWD